MEHPERNHAFSSQNHGKTGAFDEPPALLSIQDQELSMTTFSMNFDFSTAEQRGVLRELQDQNFTLLAYRGAFGPSQIDVGVPTWFAVPFGNIFGETTIDYTPKFKVYVFSQANIAANTTIKTQVLSGETELGSGMTFMPEGDFVASDVSTPKDSIGLKNNRPAGTPQITVGLAGLVNLPTGAQYLPFCAFSLAPQNSIVMTPRESILLVAARQNLESGNVQANVAAPGATFAFSQRTIRPDGDTFVVRDHEHRRIGGGEGRGFRHGDRADPQQEVNPRAFFAGGCCSTAAGPLHESRPLRARPDAKHPAALLAMASDRRNLFGHAPLGSTRWYRTTRR
jgi:hypothetical protein